MTDSATQPSSGAQPAPSHLVVARVVRPHGVRGDLRVESLTPAPQRLRELETVFVGRDPSRPASLKRFAVLTSRPEPGTPGHWLIHLEGIEDRDQADRLRGAFFCVALENAVPLAEDEVYLYQVIGLEVRTPAGEVLGRVESLIETGANDVYVITGGPRGEVLIPAVHGVILDIQPEAGFMLVDPPAGLLPDLP